MSGARDTILSALEAARPPAAPSPPRTPHPGMPDDPLARLRERVEEAGGRLQRVRGAEELNGIEWPVDLAAAEHVHSAWPALASRGAGARASRPDDLAALDLCLLQGAFAVVENGAVWHVPASSTERAAALLAEHLLIAVSAKDLVPTLHQAYQRIDLAGIDFGWFLCGPSKTADIEQSLVFGAHGPRSMSLVLIED